MTGFDSREEERFKYEVIRGLSESVRQLASGMADMQKTQVGMLERLAKLEANRIGEEVTAMKALIVALDTRVDVLFRDKDRRDGARGALGMIKDWSPFVAAIMATLAAAWLYGRSIGLTPAPPVAPVRVEATGNPQDQHIVGVVGGKP